MSNTQVQVLVPPQPAAPRGAIWAADAVVWLTHKLGAVTQAVVRVPVASGGL